MTKTYLNNSNKRKPLVHNFFNRIVYPNWSTKSFLIDKSKEGDIALGVPEFKKLLNLVSEGMLVFNYSLKYKDKSIFHFICSVKTEMIWKARPLLCFVKETSMHSSVESE